MLRRPTNNKQTINRLDWPDVFNTDTHGDDDDTMTIFMWMKMRG